MSIIKGKQNVVAGFGGTKRCIGEVYFSQSGLASDNPGALPGWTGEYYENGKTLFPDLYNFVKAHSELQVTKTDYDNAIATYGECPKYVVDENAETTTETDVDLFIKEESNGGTYLFRNDPPSVGDDYWLVALSPSEIPDNITLGTPTGKITAVTTNTLGVISSVTFGSDTTTDWESVGNALADITTTSSDTGTSLRLPKYANYIKMAGADGITQKGAGLPNITGSIDPYVDMNRNWSGAFSVNKTAPTNPSGTSGNGNGSHVMFDASKSNAIYGASDTVQPAHTTLYPWISAYTSAIPASVAQVAEFTGALAGKANIDLANTTPATSFINKSMAWGIPDYSAGVSVRYPYTAPTAGLFTAFCTTGVDYIKIGGVDIGMRFSANNHAAVFVKAGDVVQVEGTGGATCHFFPLSGTK